MYIVEVNPIVSIEINASSPDNATLICKLACFSIGLRCVLHNTTAKASNVSNILGSATSYDYPTQLITLANLTNNTTYCVVAVNKTNMMEVGDLICGSFIDTGGEM